MKKILLLFLAVVTVILASCGDFPSMEDVTMYQSGDFSAFVSSGGASLSGVISRKDGEFTFTVETPAEISGTVFYMSDGVCHVKYDDTDVSLASGGTVGKIFGCFSLGTDVAWKISVGDGTIKCVSDGIKAYYDEATRLPVRFELENISIDVSRFSVIKSGGAE